MVTANQTDTAFRLAGFPFGRPVELPADFVPLFPSDFRLLINLFTDDVVSGLVKKAGEGEGVEYSLAAEILVALLNAGYSTEGRRLDVTASSGAGLSLAYAAEVDHRSDMQRRIRDLRNLSNAERQATGTSSGGASGGGAAPIPSGDFAAALAAHSRFANAHHLPPDLGPINQKLVDVDGDLTNIRRAATTLQGDFIDHASDSDEHQDAMGMLTRHTAEANAHVDHEALPFFALPVAYDKIIVRKRLPADFASIANNEIHLTSRSAVGAVLIVNSSFFTSPLPFPNVFCYEGVFFNVTSLDREDTNYQQYAISYVLGTDGNLVDNSEGKLQYVNSFFPGWAISGELSPLASIHPNSVGLDKLTGEVRQTLSNLAEADNTIVRALTSLEEAFPENFPNAPGNYVLVQPDGEGRRTWAIVPAGGLTAQQTADLASNTASRWPGELFIVPHEIEKVAVPVATTFRGILHSLAGQYPNGARARLSIAGSPYGNPVAVQAGIGTEVSVNVNAAGMGNIIRNVKGYVDATVEVVGSADLVAIRTIHTTIPLIDPATAAAAGGLTFKEIFRHTFTSDKRLLQTSADRVRFSQNIESNTMYHIGQPGGVGAMIITGANGAGTFVVANSWNAGGGLAQLYASYTIGSSDIRTGIVGGNAQTYNPTLVIHKVS